MTCAEKQRQAKQEKDADHEQSAPIGKFLVSDQDDREHGGEPDPAPLQLTDEEIDLLAKVVWGEARGESAEGQQAVAEVVLNRLASESFPNYLQDVVHAENQFHTDFYLDEATPEQAQYDAIDHAIYGPYILPEDVVHFATYRATENVWGQIGGHYFCYQGN